MIRTPSIGDVTRGSEGASFIAVSAAIHSVESTAFVETLIRSVNKTAITGITIKVRTIPKVPRIPTPGLVTPISPRINESRIPIIVCPRTVPSPIHIPRRIPIKIIVRVVQSCAPLVDGDLNTIGILTPSGITI